MVGKDMGQKEKAINKVLLLAYKIQSRTPC